MQLQSKEMMIASGRLVDSGQLCELHNEHLYSVRIPSGKLSNPFCFTCKQTEIQQENAERVAAAYQQSKKFHSFGVFERESIITPELEFATFENFQHTDVTENNALYFARKMAKHYFDDGKGNTIFTGPPGVGKSHLTIAMARELHANFDKFGHDKSMIFMPVSRLFSKIQDSFNGGGNFTENRAVELLTNVDFLFLDDLGKEAVMSNQIKAANEWKQQVLFNILDNRERTIINTNFSSNQLRAIYDAALADRIFKGSKDQVFKFPEGAKSKRW